MKTTIRPHTTESPMSLVSSSWISPAHATTRPTDDAERFAASRFCASTDETVAIDERARS